MISYDTESRLANIFKQLAAGEEEIKGYRKRLTNNEQFDSNQILKSLDKENKDRIEATDLIVFLREKGIDTNEEQAQLIIFFYDKDYDGALSLEELNYLLLGEESQREYNEVGENQMTSNNDCIEYFLASLLEKENELAKLIIYLLDNIKLKHDFNIHDLYHSVTGPDCICKSSLRCFFERIKVNCTDEELENIIARLDVNRDHKVDLCEFHAFLGYPHCKFCCPHSPCENCHTQCCHSCAPPEDVKCFIHKKAHPCYHPPYKSLPYHLHYDYFSKDVYNIPQEEDTISQEEEQENNNPTGESPSKREKRIFGNLEEQGFVSQEQLFKTYVTQEEPEIENQENFPFQGQGTDYQNSQNLNKTKVSDSLILRPSPERTLSPKVHECPGCLCSPCRCCRSCHSYPCICNNFFCQVCQSPQCRCCKNCHCFPCQCFNNYQEEQSQCCEICHNFPCQCLNSYQMWESSSCCNVCHFFPCRCCQVCHYLECRCCHICHFYPCCCCNICHYYPCRCCPKCKNFPCKCCPVCHSFECQCCDECQAYPCKCCKICHFSECRCCKECKSFPCRCCMVCHSSPCKCCPNCSSFPCRCCPNCHHFPGGPRGKSINQNQKPNQNFTPSQSQDDKQIQPIEERKSSNKNNLSEDENNSINEINQIPPHLHLEQGGFCPYCDQFHRHLPSSSNTETKTIKVDSKDLVITQDGNYFNITLPRELFLHNEDVPCTHVEKSFINYIQKMMFVESQLEREKMNLSQNEDFNIEDVFRIFEHENKEYITNDELKRGLKLFGIDPNELNIKLLLKRYDLKQKGYINYSDFFNIFVPFETTVRRIVENRPPNSCCSESAFSTLSNKTINDIKDFLNLVLTYERKLNDLRKNHGPLLLKLSDVFGPLDKKRQGFFGIEDLYEYLHKHKIFTNKKDSDLTFLRLDRTRKGKIDYGEMEDHLRPL